MRLSVNCILQLCLYHAFSAENYLLETNLWAGGKKLQYTVCTTFADIIMIILRSASILCIDWYLNVPWIILPSDYLKYFPTRVLFNSSFTFFEGLIITFTGADDGLGNI